MYCFFIFRFLPFLFAFADGGLGFEFCVFVVGWWHAFRSEWPCYYRISINIYAIPYTLLSFTLLLHLVSADVGRAVQACSVRLNCTNPLT